MSEVIVNEPIAVSGTRRAIKELVDGTLRVQIDIDPPQKEAFLKLFPNIDVPIALTPLVNDFEKKLEKPIGGSLSKSAAMMCQNQLFFEFVTLGLRFTEVKDTTPSGIYNAVDCVETCAQAIRSYCKIESRAELDHNPKAAKLFQTLMQKYRDWIKPTKESDA